MDKIIVYYPYKLRKLLSGSAVRPVKMIEAFKTLALEYNLELIEIHGNSLERSRKLKNLYQNISPKQIRYCYIENSTIPMWLTDDDHIPRKPTLEIKFLQYLKNNKIPVGIFYRDAYWKFNDLYTIKPGIKQIMQLLFKMELYIFKKYGSVFYLPSVYMNEYVKFPKSNVIPLPPGGNDFIDSNGYKKQIDKPNAVYVGGIHPRYGVYEMLKAIENINKDQIELNLLMVCRKKELEKYKKLLVPYLDKEWLTIFHAYGEELIPIYRKAHFGIVPIKRDVYNDFAVAVKMFEYLSYGLPIVATDCKAQKDLVEENNFGIIVKSEPESMAKGIKKMLERENLDFYRNEAISAFRDRHLWFHRALTVHNSLLSSKY